MSRAATATHSAGRQCRAKYIWDDEPETMPSPSAVAPSPMKGEARSASRAATPHRRTAEHHQPDTSEAKAARVSPLLERRATDDSVGSQNASEGAVHSPWHRIALFLATTSKWLTNVAYLVYSLGVLAWEVVAGVLGVPITTPEYNALKGQLAKAQSFPEWRAIARMLDNLDGYDRWRTEEASSFFNFEGVMRCLQEFAELKRSGHTRALLEALLCRVHRSLYGVNNSNLYRQYLTGTKNIIHSYTSLMCYLIRDLANVPASQGQQRGQQTIGDVDATSASRQQHENHRMQQQQQQQQQQQSITAAASSMHFTDVTPPPVPAMVTAQQRHDALQQMRIVYGCTALVLNGGSLVGPLHLGVAKALHEADLLPQIIYGYRSGAIVAALLCCKDDLSVLMSKHQINFKSLSGKESEATSMRRWRRLWREGHLMDAGVLLHFMRDNIGEVTFQEAYRRTGRVLNIQYTSFYRNRGAGRTHRRSCLLNYLTAPNVLVYSAAVCSMASTPVMFPRVPLLARSLDGAIVEYDPVVLTRGYPQLLSDDESSPPATSLHRLREMFHVQYFIVSECSSLAKPDFLRRQEHSRTAGFVAVAWLHFFLTELVRLLWWLLCQTPLERYLATVLDNDMAECGVEGDAMVLIPQLSWRDLYALWGSLSPAEMRRCVVASERQVWPRLEEIRMNQSIERAIADALLALREDHPFDIKR